MLRHQEVYGRAALVQRWVQATSMVRVRARVRLNSEGRVAVSG